MEYGELIQKRYSVRKFKEQEIPDEDLARIVDAARIAPSGKNSQNWHFVVVRDRALIKRMEAIVNGRIEKIAEGLPDDKAALFRKFSKFSTFFAAAPAVIAVYAGEYIPEGLAQLVESGDGQENIDRLIYANPGMQGIGGAICQMILAAFDLGYGACWMTSANNSILALEEAIGFGRAGYKLVALVPVGIPEGERRSPEKKPLQDVMTIIG